MFIFCSSNKTLLQTIFVLNNITMLSLTGILLFMGTLGSGKNCFCARGVIFVRKQIGRQNHLGSGHRKGNSFL